MTFERTFSCEISAASKGIGARSSSVITFSLKSVGNHQERKMYLKHLGDQFYLTIVKNSFRWLLDFESTGVLPSDAALLSLRVSSESSAAATGKRSSKDRISLWSVSEDTECSVNWTIRDSGLLGGGERLWWLKPLCPSGVGEGTVDFSPLFLYNWKKKKSNGFRKTIRWLNCGQPTLNSSKYLFNWLRTLLPHCILQGTFW